MSVPRVTLAILVVVVSVFATTARAQIRSTAGGGPWNQGTTWVGGNVPTSTDLVEIAAGSTVTLSPSFECAGLTVEQGATLSSGSSYQLVVTGPVVNNGSITGAAGIEAHGDVTNNGAWTMRLHFGGDGPRTVQAPGVEGDQWITGTVTLEGSNTISRIDAFQSTTGSMLVQEGATLRLSVVPTGGYTPAGLGLPDDEELDSRGTIIVPNQPDQFSGLVIASNLIGSFETLPADTILIETHADQVHPNFSHSIRQWFRMSWSGSSQQRDPFSSLSFTFDGTQLGGLDPTGLYVYHSPNGGQNWTRVTESPFQIIYEPTAGLGFVTMQSVPSEGDYVISDDAGPGNSAPIAVNDIAFAMQSESVLIDVLRNDSDADGDPIRVVDASDGNSGTTSIEGNQIRYVPAGGFVGEDTFTYAITDDVAGDAGATVTVRVADHAIAIFTGASDEVPTPAPNVLRRRTVEMNWDHIRTLTETENGSIAMNLFDDVTVVLDQTGLKRWSADESAWLGGSDRFGDWVSFEFDSANQNFFATAWANAIPYHIKRALNGSFVVEELDLSGLKDENNPDFVADSSRADRGFEVLEVREVEGPSSSALGKNEAAQADPSIDVLVLFTTSARDSSGSQASMQLEIFNAINNTNQTYRNSGVNAVVRLAGVAMVAYDETGDAEDDLDNLTAAGQNADSDVAKLREQFKADVVGVVVGGTDACGIANLMSSVGHGFEDRAFFIVVQGNCLGGNLSFAHEIGHIQGARHDRFVDDADGSPYDYNHGWVNPLANWTTADVSWGPNQWRTVMAYNDRCDCADEVSSCPSSDNRATNGPNCTRLMWWSNPNNTWTGGFPMGVASGSNASNNTRTLNNTAATVAGFRGAQPSISGTITDVSTGQGLAGVLMEGVSATQGYTTISDGAGFYALLAPFGTTLVVTPVLAGYAFDPPAIAVSNLSGDVFRDFDAAPLFTVGGKVTFNNGGLLDVEIRGVPNTGIFTGGGGTWSVELPWDWPGTLTPYHPGYDFTPASVSFDTLRTDSLQNNFVATVKQFTISGSINAFTGGVIGVVMEGLPGNPVTDHQGNYSATVDYGWSGEVRPTRDGYSFEPFSRAYVSVSRDLDHDYDAFAGGLARSEWPMFASSPFHRSRLDIPTFTNEPTWSATFEGDLNPPVVGQDGTVYVTVGTDLHALAADGTRLWNEIVPNATEASPAVGTAGRLYVPSGGVVIAFNVFDRSADWSYFTGDRILSSPAIDELGNVYVGSNSDSLFAISPDGVRLWAFGTGGDVRSSPAIAQTGAIYFGSDDGKVYALDADGGLMWSHDTGGAVRSSPTIGDSGEIIVGTDADAVLALDPDTGVQLWRFDTGGDVQGTPALDSESHVYFGSADSTFYALNPDGTLDWSYDTNGPISKSAAVSYSRVRRLTPGADEEVVYVSNESNTVYAFTIRTPNGFNDRLRWQYFGSSMGPVLTSAGLLVGTENTFFPRLTSLKPESRSLVQLSVLLNDFGVDFDPDKLAAILWFESFGGPLALFPDPEDPCSGGPLIIPDCPLNDTFDAFNKLVLAQADQDLVLGLVQWTTFLADVINGTSTEGLLSTFNLKLNSNTVSSIILAGLLDPINYAPNPDGRSTELSLFTNSFARSVIADPESVYLMSGNLSTDASALDFSVSGNQSFDFSALGFGDLSNLVAVPEGQYDVVLRESGFGKSEGRLLASGTLDLTGKAGQIVSVFAKGFMDPAANNGGPGIGIVAASGGGEVLVNEPTSSEELIQPERLRLEAVYPNPSRGRVTVAYEATGAGSVRVDVYDMLGRRVRTSVDDAAVGGSRTVTIDTSSLGSGLYLIRIESAGDVVTGKMTVL